MSPTLLRLIRLKERLKIPGVLTSIGGSSPDMNDQSEYLLNGKLFAKGCPGARRALRELAGVKEPAKAAKQSVQKLNPLPTEAKPSWKEKVL